MNNIAKKQDKTNVEIIDIIKLLKFRASICSQFALGDKKK